MTSMAASASVSFSYCMNPFRKDTPVEETATLQKMIWPNTRKQFSKCRESTLEKHK